MRPGDKYGHRITDHAPIRIKTFITRGLHRPILLWVLEIFKWQTLISRIQGFRGWPSRINQSKLTWLVDSEYMHRIHWWQLILWTWKLCLRLRDQEREYSELVELLTAQAVDLLSRTIIRLIMTTHRAYAHLLTSRTWPAEWSREEWASHLHKKQMKVQQSQTKKLSGYPSRMPPKTQPISVVCMHLRLHCWVKPIIRQWERAILMMQVAWGRSCRSMRPKPSPHRKGPTWRINSMWTRMAAIKRALPIIIQASLLKCNWNSWKWSDLFSNWKK